MARNMWDFETINREVPIEEVLALHGIAPSQRTGAKGWYSIRPEDDTPSAHIDTQRRFGNTIHDFGLSNTFNPLTLTMYLQGVDIQEASRILGEAFHIPPIATSKEDKEDANKVSDYEWKMVGIHPDMASKNIDFDLARFGAESSMKLGEKYKMPMSELRERTVVSPPADNVDERDKKRYESILRSRAIPFVTAQRHEYFKNMHDDYSLAMAVNGTMDIDRAFLLHKDVYEEQAKKLTQVEAALKKILEGTTVKFKSRRYNAREDFQAVIDGEVSFEIGMSNHFDINNAAYREKAKVFYCVVSLEEYYKLSENGLDNITVAARQRGELVTLSFISTDSSKVNYLIKALRGKEALLAESFGAAIEEATKEAASAPTHQESSVVSEDGPPSKAPKVAPAAPAQPDAPKETTSPGRAFTDRFSHQK